MCVCVSLGSVHPDPCLLWWFQVDEEASLWRPGSAWNQSAPEEQTLRSDRTEMEGEEDHLQVTSGRAFSGQGFSG